MLMFDCVSTQRISIAIYGASLPPPADALQRRGRGRRPRLRHTLRQLDRAAHAHAKPTRRITTRISGCYMVRYAISKIARKWSPCAA